MAVLTLTLPRVSLLTLPEIYALVLPALILICLLTNLLWSIAYKFRYLYHEFIGSKRIGPFPILSILEIVGYLILNTVIILTGSDRHRNLKWMCVFNYGFAVWTGHNPLWLKLSPQWGHRMHFCSAFICLIEAGVHIGIVLTQQSLGNHQWLYWMVSFQLINKTKSF